MKIEKAVLLAWELHFGSKMSSDSSKSLFLMHSKKGSEAGDPFWGAGKTLFSEEHMANTWAKRTFGNIAKTIAVRKGELLRGMASQGRPDPLRQCFKVSRSDSA